SDGSGAAGTDYVATSGTLTFGPGISKQTFSVQLKDNRIVDGNRTVNLTLSNPGGGALLGTPAAAVLTIVDNDTAGNVRFSKPSYSVRVSAGTVTITVTRSGGSAGRVTVNYMTNGGTAVAGVDYVATFGTLGFGPGVNSQTFTITLINNGGHNLTVNL